jgi:hypothetical protein
VGEISWEEYPLAALEVLMNCGAKLSATANSVTMNLEIRIFDSSIFSRVSDRNRDSVKGFAITFS